jgi:catechol 2,3-dioxygenase-like lactoylglutathione lyase family enzyme
VRSAVSRLPCSVDHVVLYSADTDATARFWGDQLGFPLVGFDECQRGERPTFRVKLGSGQFVNVHPAGSQLHPRAAVARPGGLDICLLIEATMPELVEALDGQGIAIEVGPVERTTAEGRPSLSAYVRDPDGNLVELMALRSADVTNRPETQPARIP